MMTLGADRLPPALDSRGLAALPAIWWLLRLTPPSPQVVVFPPTRLLKDLKTTEETPAHSPWWLTALRMLLAALLIFALARPVLNPDQQSFAGDGPLLLVVDNGWASAAHWPERREAIEAAIERAGRDGRTVVLAFTAPGQPISDPDQPRAGARARRRAAAPALRAGPQGTRGDAGEAARRQDGLQRALALRRSRLWRGRRLRQDACQACRLIGSFAMLRPGTTTRRSRSAKPPATKASSPRAS